MRKTARKTALFPTGFTLIELVMTLVILGIVSAMVAVFLQRPVQGYFDTARRAQIVDAADFALRRIARDLATAVPNSVRSSNPLFMELLQSRSGGRYCNATDCGNPLIDGDTTFAVIGPAVIVANRDSVVIGNLPNSGCNAYVIPAGSNLNLRPLNFVSSPTTTIQFTGAAFSGSCAEITKRFEIVVGPVTYACEAATQTLWRYSGYAITGVVQTTTIAGLDALVATGVSGVPGVKAAIATNVNCAAGDATNMGTNFDTSAVGEGLVELRIQLRDASLESVNLYRQVKVDNTP